ncbi:hypothetical protein [Sinorhizobium medicae]|uniref:hypothetical protein n=1 Tax=Sinorhizobium medicae TaxID=110321 RepID=UPI001296C1EE|nr:hypothetical protein [Sinorhizobium medicae]MDX0967311.1 hypothetical protein [Sinorhizobium medicae]MQV46319.1 hypothetical protein [Sinorhizobium medicae]MQV54050.1 hypothetical protein [Sinorhizobium medicae]MQV71689.1 hypothetical protein [Sinorhizobium medicae]
MVEQKIKPVLSKVEQKLISAATIFMAVDTIRKAGLEEAFLAECAKNDRGMVISKSDLNFVKTFLADFANRSLLGADAGTLLPNIKRIAKSQPQC